MTPKRQRPEEEELESLDDLDLEYLSLDPEGRSKRRFDAIMAACDRVDEESMRVHGLPRLEQWRKEHGEGQPSQPVDNIEKRTDHKESNKDWTETPTERKEEHKRRDKANVRKPWDDIERGTREYELWTSIERWTKRTHPESHGAEFLDKTSMDRRAMVSRLFEYLAWRVSISKELDPSNQPIINEKTGKPRAMSAYSLTVLTMELYNISHTHMDAYDRAKIKRSFQDAATDLISENNLDTSQLGNDEHPLAYYAENEGEEYPDLDGEDFEAPAARATRELRARRRKEKKRSEDFILNAVRDDPKSTEEDIARAESTFAAEMDLMNVEEALRAYPPDEYFSNMWDEAGQGCMNTNAYDSDSS